METKFTDLEKRLISMMQLGIRIESRDGHRWICCEDNDIGYNFDDDLRKHGILLNSKVYGSYLDAMALIDECLKRTGKQSLLDSFWQYDEIAHYQIDYSRIETRSPGIGGLS